MRRLFLLFAANTRHNITKECQRMMNYIHHRKNWPKLTWSHERLAGQLAGVRHRQGRLIGRTEGLGFSLRSEAVLQTLTEDVLKSSEIEGEKLDKDQVQSSIARRLGLDIGGLIPVDRHVEGAACSCGRLTVIPFRLLDGHGRVPFRQSTDSCLSAWFQSLSRTVGSTVPEEAAWDYAELG